MFTLQYQYEANHKDIEKIKVAQCFPTHRSFHFKITPRKQRKLCILIMQMLFCSVECAFICATCAGLMILCCVCCCCGSIHQIRVFGIYVMCCCCTKVMFGKIIRTTNFNMFWTYHLSSVISFVYRVFRWFVLNLWKNQLPPSAIFDT